MRTTSRANLVLLTVLALALATSAGASAGSVLLTEVADETLSLPDDANVVGGEDRYVIGFYELPEDRESYHGHRVLRANDAIHFLVVQTDNPVLLRQQAMLDENVRYVEWDPFRTDVLTLVPNDARYGDAGHYGSKKIGAEAAWDRTLGSTAVKVAHIDSGLNKDHEEFAGSGRVLQGYDFVSYDSEPEDEKGSLLYGCNYHGTHTTGTHGATINNGLGIAGLAQSTILPIKGIGGGSFCSATESGLADALTYAADQGAHVVSNSWRFPSTTSLLLDAIDYTHAAGTMIVSAAGNNGPCTNCVENPWKQRADKVFIVASSDVNDAQSSFSSEGPEVDIIAPGTDVLSSTASPSSYSVYSGTSMATPHVAGVAALVKALEPTWGTADITSRLQSTAVDIGLGVEEQGAGRLNADGATNGLGGGTPTVYACSDGVDNDGDGLVDYPADLGCTSSSDNDETDPVTSGTMHVHGIAHSSGGGKPSTRSLFIDVDVFDGAEAGLAGVSTCVTVTKQGGSTASGCGSTDANGRIRFEWASVGTGTFTTCVDSLTKTGYSWDQTADHASSGRCHTSSV